MGVSLRECAITKAAEDRAYLISNVLVPKLLLVMDFVKLGYKKGVHLPSVGEQTAN